AAMIFRELILTINFAILASLGVALTIVPMLSAQLAKIRFSSGLERSKPIVAFNRLMDRLTGAYRWLASRTVVRWRWAVLGVSVLALVGAFALTRDLGTEFLPQVDDGNVGVFISLPPGASAEETDAIALEIEDMVRQMPHVENMFVTAGGFLWGGGTSERAGRGSMTIILSPVSQRDMSADQWVQTLQAKINERGFPGARIFVRPPRIRGLRTSSSGSAIALSVQGDDLDELQRIADEIVRRVQGV